MAAGVDNLDNKHANTQVPKVVGYQRIAELCDDKTYDEAARFFWHTVVDTRSLALGGNSRREHFAAKDDCKSYVDDREGPESCNTNNMLKLTEGLFRMSPEARYADFLNVLCITISYLHSILSMADMCILLLHVRLITGYILLQTVRCGAA